MMILQSHKIRSHVPRPEEQTVATEGVAPQRRQKAEPPVIHEEVVGVRRDAFSHVPSALWNELVGVIRNLLSGAAQALESSYRENVDRALPNLMAETIPALVYAAGREVMTGVLQEERGFLSTTIPCHETGCRQSLTFEGYIERTIVTMLGEIKVRRAYYHGTNCKHTAFPLDSLLGLDSHGMLPQLQEAVALMSSRMSFPSATDVINRLLPVETNHTSVERITHTVAGHLQAEQEARREKTFVGHQVPEAEFPADGKVAVLAADGGMYRHRSKDEPYKEFKAAVMGWLGHSCDDKPLVEGKRYLAHAADIDTMWEHVLTSYHRWGFAQAKTLVCLADGADCYWTRFPLLKQSGQELFLILDFYHASEYLSGAARAFHGDSPEGQAWARRQAKGLKRGGIKQVLKALQELATAADAQHKEDAAAVIRTAHRYLLERKHLLRYKEARRRGFPIGSGMIEGGVRFVGKDRLHDTGMRWSQEGAERILQLRSLDVSGEWDDFTARRRQRQQADHQARTHAWMSQAA